MNPVDSERVRSKLIKAIDSEESFTLEEAYNFVILVNRVMDGIEPCCNMECFKYLKCYEENT